MKRIMVATLMGCLAAILILADSFGGPPLPAGPSLPKIKPKRVEEMKKQIQPKPRVGPIRISGHVTVPDGRGLGNVKVKLYEILDSGFRYVGDVTTTKAGFYSIALGGKWFNKKVRLVPKHPAFREGEHFSRREDIFQITNDKMPNRNFRYTGPLPDLGVMGYKLYEGEDCGPRVGVYRGTCMLIFIVNTGSLESGRCKVRVSISSVGGFVEKIAPVPSIPACHSKDFPPYRPVGIWLGEEPKDLFTIRFIQVDIDDSVVESDETNNIF